MSQVEPDQFKRQAEQRNASPDRPLDTPHLRSMLSTAELSSTAFASSRLRCREPSPNRLSTGDGDLT